MRSKPPNALFPASVALSTPSRRIIAAPGLAMRAWRALQLLTLWVGASERMVREISFGVASGSIPVLSFFLFGSPASCKQTNNNHVPQIIEFHQCLYATCGRRQEDCLAIYRPYMKSERFFPQYVISCGLHVIRSIPFRSNLH